MTAKYVQPRIQQQYSSSGTRYSNRPLNASETSALTNAVKDEVKIVIDSHKWCIPIIIIY